MRGYDITVRIDEYGLHVCQAATVRQEFGPHEVYYNEPFESWPVELSKCEYSMVYRFRSKHSLIGRKPK